MIIAMHTTVQRPTLVRRLQTERGVNIYALYSLNSAYSQEIAYLVGKKAAAIKNKSKPVSISKHGL